MANKLTDAQRVILATAAARDSGSILPIPDSLGFSAGTRALVLKGLTAKGLLAERTATEDEPVWRVDEQTGKLALIISPAGLQAIGVEADGGPVQPKPAAEAPKPRRKLGSRRAAAGAANKASKQDTVIAMLRRGGGASIAEMMEATGWQAHSVRGFMSGALKKRLGIELVSEKSEGSDRRYYVAAMKPSDN